MSTAEMTATASQPAAAEPTAAKFVENLDQFLVRKIQSGVSYSKIKVGLMEEQGLDGHAAEAIVAELKKARSRALRVAGPKNMLAGALWCIGGTAVTVITLQMASGPGGGHYVVAWGAILFGAIQFLNGIGQTLRGLV